MSPRVGEGAQGAPRLGVLGWPVAHSRSPRMHTAALAAMGLAGWRYQLLPVPPDLFAETVRALPGAGFAGANVTIPHKQAALAVADEASERARAIGAANTLTFAADGTIAAENTDAPGLLGAVAELVARADVRGMTVQVLGAGGSARAAVWALGDAGADVAVWARRPERARVLAAELGGRAVGRPEPAELLVNCTPVGLDGGAGMAARAAARTAARDARHGGAEGSDAAGAAAVGGAGDGARDGAGDLERAAKPVDQGPDTGIEQSSSEAEALNQLGITLDGLGEYSNVVDLVYRTGGTPLLAAARKLGLRTLDGAEILVRQGALSLRIWTDREPPLDVMRKAVADVRA